METVFERTRNSRIGRNAVGTGTGGTTYTAPVRETVTVTTTSIATNASWTGTVALSKAYRLYAINTSQACRTLLYTTPAAQSADSSRPIGTDPVDGSGVMFEFVSASILLSANLSPLVDGYSGEAPAVADIPITITNLSSTGTVTVTFTFIKTEI